MTSEQLYLMDQWQTPLTAFFTTAKMCYMYSLCPSMIKINCCTQKVNIYHTSVQRHITSMTFKNGKHSTTLCMRLFSLCKCGVTNENNGSYLKNNQYIGENNRATS